MSKATGTRVTMTVPQFAERYGIPEATVRYWIQTGQGPKSAKIGRQRLFHVDAVAAWEAEAFGAVAG